MTWKLSFITADLIEFYDTAKTKNRPLSARTSCTDFRHLYLASDDRISAFLCAVQRYTSLPLSSLSSPFPPFFHFLPSIHVFINLGSQRVQVNHILVHFKLKTCRTLFSKNKWQSKTHIKLVWFSSKKVPQRGFKPSNPAAYTPLSYCINY